MLFILEASHFFLYLQLIELILLFQVPASSGQKGIDISNRMEHAGRNVIGWDNEWPVNFKTSCLKLGGAQMYGRLNSRYTQVTQTRIFLFINDNEFRYIVKSITIIPILQKTMSIICMFISSRRGK